MPRHRDRGHVWGAPLQRRAGSPSSSRSSNSHAHLRRRFREGSKEVLGSPSYSLTQACAHRILRIRGRSRFGCLGAYCGEKADRRRRSCAIHASAPSPPPPSSLPPPPPPPPASSSKANRSGGTSSQAEAPPAPPAPPGGHTGSRRGDPNVSLGGGAPVAIGVGRGDGDAVAECGRRNQAEDTSMCTSMCTSAARPAVPTPRRRWQPLLGDGPSMHCGGESGAAPPACDDPPLCGTPARPPSSAPEPAEAPAAAAASASSLTTPSSVALKRRSTTSRAPAQTAPRKVVERPWKVTGRSGLAEPTAARRRRRSRSRSRGGRQPCLERPSRVRCGRRDRREPLRA